MMISRQFILSIFLLLSSYLYRTALCFVVRIPNSSSYLKTYNNNVQRQQQQTNAEDSEDSSDDIVAKRITVTGPSVQGGYYRSCVLNEVRMKTFKCRFYIYELTNEQHCRFP
jgi:hypothetical protein